MSYDPREEWFLYQVEELPSHNTTKFRFRSIEVKNVNGYDMRKCKDVYEKFEQAAWRKLKRVEWFT